MILGRHQSTISQELHPNTGLGGYRPPQVQRVTKEPRSAKIQPPIYHTTWPNVTKLTQQNWSPEKISQWLKTKLVSLSVMNGFTSMFPTIKPRGNTYGTRNSVVSAMTAITEVTDCS